MPAILNRLRTAAQALVLCTVALLPAHVSADNPVLDRVLERKVLKVAMTGEQPPFNMRNKSGDLVGYDVSLAEALANAMQVELEIVTVPFVELLPTLQMGSLRRPPKLMAAICSLVLPIPRSSSLITASG